MIIMFSYRPPVRVFGSHWKEPIYPRTGDPPVVGSLISIALAERKRYPCVKERERFYRIDDT